MGSQHGIFASFLCFPSFLGINYDFIFYFFLLSFTVEIDFVLAIVSASGLRLLREIVFAGQFD